MIEDKNYCMNSFLMYRTIADHTKTFKQGIKPKFFEEPKNRCKIHNSLELENYIKKYMKENVDDKTALMLSGGIDSAILAYFMPKGSVAYTMRCIDPDSDVKYLDESESAKRIADICGLEHRIIDITWNDYKKFSPLLMEHKGAPIHSIEPQIYKTALQAKKDGFTKLIFGESADVIYGGLDKLLSKDWNFNDFCNRYIYADPTKILKNGKKDFTPFEKYRKDNNKIDFVSFIAEFFYAEGAGSYTNACELAGVQFLSPYNTSTLAVPLDLNRIRGGDSKYFVREVYRKLFPDVKMNKKNPMPRAVKEWLKEWNGPTREEFIPNCVQGLNGDEKWQVYILEQYLNQIEKDD